MRISDWSSDVCSSDLGCCRRADGRAAKEQSPKTNGQTTERSRAAPHRQCYRHQIATIVAVDSYTERQSGDGEENAVGKTREKTKFAVARSEGRRVGKESVSTGRSRWNRCHKKKKKTE